MSETRSRNDIFLKFCKDGESYENGGALMAFFESLLVTLLLQCSWFYYTCQGSSWVKFVLDCGVWSENGDHGKSARVVANYEFSSTTHRNR